jgi:two-component system response regulator
MQPEVGDTRGSARLRMLKGGMIMFSGRHATIPCVVRDMSNGGARLQVAQVTHVPDTFELLVELDGIEVSCRTAWRKATEIGVEFLELPRRLPPRRVQVVAQSGAAQVRPTLRRHAAPPQQCAASGWSSEAKATPAVPLVARDLVAPVATDTPSPGAQRRLRTADNSNVPILVAEDDPDDRLLLRDAFEEAGLSHPLAFVENGVELLTYLKGWPPFEARRLPGLILLDLNMPKMDGRTALVEIKGDSHIKRIPIIVMTTSNAEDDIQTTYDLGVTAYVSKPGTHQGLVDIVSSLGGFWMRHVELPGA